MITIELAEIEQALAVIRKLNQAKLSEVVFLLHGAAVEQPTAAEVEEWEFTGLNNKDFVEIRLETGLWPHWVKVRDSEESETG